MPRAERASRYGPSPDKMESFDAMACYLQGGHFQHRLGRQVGAPLHRDLHRGLREDDEVPAARHHAELRVYRQGQKDHEPGVRRFLQGVRRSSIHGCLHDGVDQGQRLPRRGAHYNEVAILRHRIAYRLEGPLGVLLLRDLQGKLRQDDAAPVMPHQADPRVSRRDHPDHLEVRRVLPGPDEALRINVGG
eukprot:CAMPEP_0203913992 /NCGR_PEP_ID=MMETSP0359-20131031/54936_1 /ASSEMBLY_ACC=CAM_ASM_000338 /TAXON_ID=268821 /ORGANISM="Scrippsiella Hangoei, Strain SHTV-5" /LENGTH=189 /DNA_ID=CAMNT_0050840245 /DNA_START=135 /DNA_END=704 /DNA_ORIENTATION=-